MNRHASDANEPMPKTSTPLKDAVAARVADDLAYLDALYRHWHAHPELSLQEEHTSTRIAAELRLAGLEVTCKVGGHGVVGVLRNGEGPVVMLRTDMDALPVEEQTGLPYASVARARDDQGNEVGVMHACGHDAHMTVFVGAARQLARLKEHWSGTLVLVAQPAEERMLGARAMLADGLFTRHPKPDCCLGLHVSPTLPAGTVGLVEGHAFANVDSVDILVRGIGGHGAFPQAAKDPVVLAAELVLALQTIISRETSPLEPAVITVGSIHGGAQRNVIPEAVLLQLTVRSFSQEVRAKLLHAIERTACGLAAATGLPNHCAPVVTVSDESTPAVRNDPALTQRLRDTFEWWLGKANVLSSAPVMGGEDFARYGRTAEAIPLCFYWLGAVSPARLLAANQADQPLPPLHSPRFAPEPLITIQTGVTTMAAAVLELMPKAAD